MLDISANRRYPALPTGNFHLVRVKQHVRFHILGHLRVKDA